MLIPEPFFLSGVLMIRRKRSNVQIEQLGENITLYRGDCLEALPLIKRADILITSPPYNTLTNFDGGTTLETLGSYSSKVQANCYFDGKDEKDYQKFLKQVFDLCRERVKGVMWINHKIRFRDKIGIHPVRLFDYPIFAEIIWDRKSSMSLGVGRYYTSHETILGFGEPHYWDDSQNRLMTVWFVRPRVSKEHPCPYPEALVKPLVLSSCPPGGIVLDPFMGMGTSGVVAAMHGRGFAGIEMEQKYFDLACRDIEKALKRPNLFAAQKTVSRRNTQSTEKRRLHRNASLFNQKEKP